MQKCVEVCRNLNGIRKTYRRVLLLSVLLCSCVRLTDAVFSPRVGSREYHLRIADVHSHRERCCHVCHETARVCRYLEHFFNQAPTLLYGVGVRAQCLESKKEKDFQLQKVVYGMRPKKKTSRPRTCVPSDCRRSHHSHPNRIGLPGLTSRISTPRSMRIGPSVYCVHRNDDVLGDEEERSGVHDGRGKTPSLEVHLMLCP